jgi:hypothetical protein
MQERLERTTSLEGWSFYSPDHCVVEGGHDCQVYGAVYTISNMNEFDVVLNQLRALENEKAFECENDLPFARSLATLAMHDWSHGYLANSIVRKK